MALRRALALLLAVAVSAALSGCGEEGPGGPPGSPAAEAARGWNGRWRAQTPNGPTTMTIEESGGALRMSSDGGSATARVTSSGRAEGSDDTGGVSAAFVLALDGDRLTMTVKAMGEDGTPIDVPEVVFERVKAAAPSGSRDERLVGHWRHTEARSSPGFSYAFDVHLELSEDGTYASWNVDADGANPRTTGVWKTEGKSLYLKDDGGDWYEKGSFSISGSHLLLTYGMGDKQIFERL